MRDLTIRRLIVTGLLLILLAPVSSSAQWVNPPSEDLQKQTPGLVHETFDSVAMQTPVGYSVVLPSDVSQLSTGCMVVEEVSRRVCSPQKHGPLCINRKRSKK